jgi:cell division septation protein DedD
VGRNSPLATAEATPPDKADKPEKKEAKPMVVDSAAARDSSAPSQAKEAPAKETPVPTETAAQQPAETKAESPAPAKSEPAVAKREPPPPKPEPVKPKPEPVQSAAVDRPSGTYLQLAATSQREADIEVDVLRRKGFRAMSAEIPEKPGMFRVLVGPMPDADINKMRRDLQGAGFPGDKAIRRTL